MGRYRNVHAPILLGVQYGGPERGRLVKLCSRPGGPGTGMLGQTVVLVVDITSGAVAIGTTPPMKNQQPSRSGLGRGLVTRDRWRESTSCSLIYE